MKKAIILSLSLLFVSHNALMADEDTINTEEVYEHPGENENSNKAENSDKVEKEAPSDEEIEAKRVAEEASEVAHAEEVELREVGAGEDVPPLMEE